MFGLKQKNTKPASQEGDLAKEREKMAAELEARVAAAEQDAILKREEYHADVVSEHKRDIEAFRFECRRWGDYLSLNIARLPHERSVKPEAFTGAVNIREGTIKLIEGGPADADGILGYTIFVSHGRGYGWSSYPGLRIEDLSDETEYKIEPNYPRAPSREMFVPREDATDHPTIWPYQVEVQRQTPFPRYAVDDLIIFGPANATLHCPFGTGRKVYEQILQEIGDFIDAAPAGTA